MVPAIDNNSNYALATALKQAGVKLKAVLFATGYQPDVINSPAWSALQGDYFMSLFRPLVAAQRRDRADAGGHGEVRALHQDPVPDLRPVRGVGRGRPHDQGAPDGGAQPDEGRRHQGPAGHQVVRRQRPAAQHDQLRDHLRARRSRLHLGHAGREDRLHPRLLPADLRARTCRGLRRSPARRQRTARHADAQQGPRQPLSGWSPPPGSAADPGRWPTRAAGR